MQGIHIIYHTLQYLCGEEQIKQRLNYNVILWITEQLNIKIIMCNFFLNQFYTNMGGQRNLNLILDNIYPIGSIHLIIGDYNPSIYFGGNWQKISGGFLWGCNTSVDNNLMNSSVGHTKSFDTTLTINQIPSHNHEGIYEYYSKKTNL